MRYYSATFVVLVTACCAHAAPVHWDPAVGGNGHYYEIVADTVTWTQARDLSANASYLGVAGHLATITSQSEADFLRTVPLPYATKTEFWLGGYQDTNAPDYSEPLSGWRWVTGEPWSFTNWWYDEPSNNDGNNRPENYIQTAGSSVSAQNPSDFLRWNDATNTGSVGYFVEYDFPAPEPSGLAIATIGIAALLGWRLRARRNVPPTVAIAFVVTVLSIAATTQAAVIQTEVSPINGHTYHLLAPSTWTDAEAEAQAMSVHAHLATIRNEAENSWVADTFNADGFRYLWIGLTDFPTLGDFYWTSGEPVLYTKFDPSEPSFIYQGQPEYYVQMGYSTVLVSGIGLQVADRYSWNDLQNISVHTDLPLQGVVEVIPEPSGLVIAAIGGVLLLAFRARRRNLRHA